MGDIAQILEARHISRYMALLKDDLPALIAKVGSEAEGYAQFRYEIVQKGLPADVTRLRAAFDLFHKSLVKAVAPEISSMFERLANAIDRIGKKSPALLKTGIGLTAAAAAAGPLIFALGAVGRVGAFALSALLTPIGLVARGLVGLGVAMAGFATASIARLSAMLIGLRMLSTFGAGATLSAMGASLLGLGRTMLKDAATWMGNLLGPIDESGSKWRVGIGGRWCGGVGHQRGDRRHQGCDGFLRQSDAAVRSVGQLAISWALVVVERHRPVARLLRRLPALGRSVGRSAMASRTLSASAAPSFSCPAGPAASERTTRSVG